MRFDLEIPASDNIKLVFIREGESSAIPNSVAPLVYYDVETKDMFPSDFISIEPGYKPTESSFGGYDTVEGPTVKDVKSDKFLLTNKAKYFSNGSRAPLFYKHTIGSIIKEDAIKIVDYFDIELSKDEYIVEVFEDATYIYMNKQEKILFVSYSIDNKISKELLNLTPVFKEAGWDNLYSGKIDKFRYIYGDRLLATSHNEELFISYLTDTKLVRNVNGNIEDSWYVGVLNADFLDINTGLRYWIPEFYTQKLSGDSRDKFINKAKCRKIFRNYIQSQYRISANMTDALTVYVYDYYSNRLKSVFTNSPALENVYHSESIYYRMITSFNYDGVISLPVEILDTDIVYCSHYTDEEYYEYKGLDLNSDIFSSAEYIGIYIKPNVVDTSSSLGHVVIGGNESNVSNVPKFDTLEDFYDSISNDQFSDCYLSYVAAIISVTNKLEDAGISLIDVSSDGGVIKDKLEVAKIDLDVIYDDILSGLVNIPTNDVIIAELDITRLENEGKASVTDYELNDDALKYIKTVKKVLKKNLDVSTFQVIKVHSPNLITDKYLIGE